MTNLDNMPHTSRSALVRPSFEISHTNHNCIAHKRFTLDYEAAPLGFLISMPKALGVLMVHKVRDNRFQSLLVKWARMLLALLAAAYCGFNLMPTLLATSVFALGGCLLAFLLWLDVGDVLLEFALEDQRFFELATGCRALSVVEDPELSLPQPTGFSPYPAGQI
jgi:hypothetical protein